MEFVCVLSVSGALASYGVRGNGADDYNAVLRNEGRTDIPAQMQLRRVDGQWRMEPEHEEIGKALILCIESNGVKR